MLVNKMDSARVRYALWLTVTCLGLVVGAGLVWVALRAYGRVIPQTHECDLSEIATYTGIILPENTALLGGKFWAWADSFEELVAKVRFERRELDLFVNSLPGELSKQGPPLGPDSPPRPLMNETAIRGVGAWWNPDAARDYMYISYRRQPKKVDVGVLIDLDDKEYVTVFVKARWNAL